MDNLSSIIFNLALSNYKYSFKKFIVYILSDTRYDKIYCETLYLDLKFIFILLLFVESMIVRQMITLSYVHIVKITLPFTISEDYAIQTCIFTFALEIHGKNVLFVVFQYWNGEWLI